MKLHLYHNTEIGDKYVVEVLDIDGFSFSPRCKIVKILKNDYFYHKKGRVYFMSMKFLHELENPNKLLLSLL